MGKNALCGFRSHFIRNSLRILYPVQNNTNLIGRPSYREKVNAARRHRRYVQNISNCMRVQISESVCSGSQHQPLCVWILSLLVTLDKSCCIISDSEINICLVQKSKRNVSKKFHLVNSKTPNICLGFFLGYLISFCFSVKLAQSQLHCKSNQA